MKYVDPKVFHIAYTTIDTAGKVALFEHLGVSTWSTDAESSAERLIELCGRRCYRAFETDDVSVTEQNPNLTKVRKGNKEYIGNILEVKHGSVLEHAYDTFAFEDVSRVFTHEIVRHRFCNFSQESLRFVRPTSLNMYFPEVFGLVSDDPIDQPYSDGQGNYWNPPTTYREIVKELFDTTVEELENTQRILAEVLDMDTIERTFSDKKKLQSALRRLMPIGMATGIIVTANHRNWRHLIQLRTAEGAEEEIRFVFRKVAEIMADRYPAIYQDMWLNDKGETYFKHGRV